MQLRRSEKIQYQVCHCKVDLAIASFIYSVVKKQVYQIIFALLIVAFLPQWGSSQTVPTAPAGERLLLEDAKLLIQSGNVSEGISALELFFLNHPNSLLAPDTLIEAGKAYSQQGNLKKAIEILRLFLEKFPKETRINNVRSQLSYAYLGVGGTTLPGTIASAGATPPAVEAALSVWKGIAGQEAIKTPIYTRAAEIYVEQEAYAKAVRVLIQKKVFVTDSVETETTASAILAIVRNRLTEKELQAVSSEFSPNFPTDEVIIRLIKIYNKKGTLYLVEKESKHFLSLFPDHVYAEEAQQEISNIRTKVKENEYLIAVMLPLTGKLAQFGLSALQGVELALSQFKFVVPGAPVGIAVKDMNEASTASLEDWLNDYMPLGIVGPLLSKEVHQIAPVVEKERWPLITPGASAVSLPAMGTAVFRNAFTPAIQCRAIAEYATSTLNVKRFAILFPNDKSGKEWVRCFRANVTPAGGKIVLAESYLPNTADFKDQIVRIKTVYDKGYGVDGIKIEGAGIDGIFLPGEEQSAGLILPQLFFHDIKDIPLLGTMGWSDPDFLKLAGRYAEGAVFADGFFEASDDPFIKKFVSQYKKQFNDDPNLFSAQAYDAARIILEAIKDGAKTPSDIRSALATTRDFEAASGYIFEMKDGEAIKKPFLIQIKKGKLVQVN